MKRAEQCDERAAAAFAQAQAWRSEVPDDRIAQIDADRLTGARG